MIEFSVCVLVFMGIASAMIVIGMLFLVSVILLNEKNIVPLFINK